MKGFFKIMLFTSPILALIFFYVATRNDKIDLEMKQEQVEFKSEWNRFNRDYTDNSAQKKEYQQKVEENEKEAKVLEQKQQEQDKKVDRLNSEIEKTIMKDEKEK